MRAKIFLAAASLMTAAGVALAGPAAAQPVCAGTDNTVVLCVDPVGGTYIDDCVYAGPPPCKQVTVPGPTISCGGRYGAALCASISPNW
jgi:hypothetical protein